MIGLNISNLQEDEQYIASMYNVILGGGANSKLFQNVREKASLAYTAGSGYLKAKSIIIIRCGIEIKNYEKAVSIIKDQLQQMLTGDFTEEDLESAKQLIYASVKSIPDTQDGELMYYFSQELSNKFVSLDQYIDNIKKVTKEEIIKISKELYRWFDLKGVVRIDYIYDLDENKLYVNELNNIPGSLAFYLFEKEGIPFTKMIDILVTNAIIEKHNKDKKITTFESNVFNKKSLKLNK